MTAVHSHASICKSPYNIRAISSISRAMAGAAKIRFAKRWSHDAYLQSSPPKAGHHAMSRRPTLGTRVKESDPMTGT
jgi:hypothetical protein